MKKGTLVNKRNIDILFKGFVFLCTTVSLIALGAILFFILMKALPLFKEIDLFSFISGSVWSPSSGNYGILPFIVASVLTTLAAVVIGIPIGLYTAIFISDIACPKIGKAVLFFVDILASIPSVIYGFFGLTIIVPLIKNIFELKSGSTLLTASIILAFMILPTVVSLSASSLKAVPKEVVEGSLALGASKVQTIFKTKVKYAQSGIITSFLLGTGRALGETMAVILVAGNSTMMPKLQDLFHVYLNGGRTLTGNIVMELAYASGTHEAALFATGVILFMFVTIINFIAYKTQKKGIGKNEKKI